MVFGPRPFPPLGRRYLKSFAGGIAHQFSSSSEHYAYLAWKYKVRRVTIDLLALTIDPPEFDIFRNRRLAEICQFGLIRNMERLFPPARVASAVLVADFGIDIPDPQGRSNYFGPSVFTVILTDERGKAWQNVCREKDSWMVA